MFWYPPTPTSSTSRYSFFLTFFFWLHHAACGILVPPPGIEPGPSAVKALSPNHWTAREFPQGTPLSNLFFKINLFILFIYFWLCWVFIAAHRLYLWLQRAGVTLCCGVRASHCSGFSCCGAWALGARASVVVAHGLSSCGSRALECRLSSCGTRASLLCSMWDLPGPGLDPVSPSLAGGFLTTALPGKPLVFFLAKTFYFSQDFYNHKFSKIFKTCFN